MVLSYSITKATECCPPPQPTDGILKVGPEGPQGPPLCNFHATGWYFLEHSLADNILHVLRYLLSANCHRTVALVLFYEVTMK